MMYIVHVRQSEKVDIDLKGCLILRHFPVFCITSIKEFFQIFVDKFELKLNIS